MQLLCQSMTCPVQEQRDTGMAEGERGCPSLGAGRATASHLGTAAALPFAAAKPRSRAAGAPLSLSACCCSKFSPVSASWLSSVSAAGREPGAGGEDGMLRAIAHILLSARAKDHFSP